MVTTAELIEFVRRLRSVRHFRPDPVPQEAIDAILTVLRWSGSAKNVQPWEFIVIRDRETLNALGSIHDGYNAAHLKGAPLGIALVMDGDPSHYDQETFDEGRLAERCQLAAAAHGLGSVIGWFDEHERDQVRELLGIPQGRLIRTILSVGYPDEEAHAARPRRPQPRKPLDQIVHYDRMDRRGS
jgi:nitroreductase